VQYYYGILLCIFVSGIILFFFLYKSDLPMCGTAVSYNCCAVLSYVYTVNGNGNRRPPTIQQVATYKIYDGGEFFLKSEQSPSTFILPIWVLISFYKIT